jgi:hypothetical protein
LSTNSGASTSWNLKGLSRPVAGKLLTGKYEGSEGVVYLKEREQIHTTIISPF